MAMTRLMEIGTHEEQRLLMHHNASLPLAIIESPTAKNQYERAAKVSFSDIYSTGIQLMQTSLLSITLIAMILLFGQWIPALVVVAVASLLWHATGKSAESIERTDRSQTGNRRLLRHYADLMTKREAAKELRLFGLQPLLASRWVQLHQQQSRETLLTASKSEVRKLGPSLLMALLSGLLIALLVLIPHEPELSAGGFSLLFMAFTMLQSQLTSLISQGASMRTMYMRWEDYNAYMKQVGIHDIRVTSSESPAQESSSLVAASASVNELDLRVQQLSFAYPGSEKLAVNDVSFNIPSGCRAALVGHNGSGKSTLVKVLTGLYALSGGDVVWQHSDGNRSPRAERDHMSAVFQDFTKLAITLRENVAISELSELNNDSKLSSTLQAVGSNFTDLDEQIGAAFGGMEPSGGEWQRIVTARALLRNAKFVFFDEPTAALDPAAEKQAFELFLQVTQGRSALMVTHRLGAARLADLILVMKDGVLVESGSHDELMQLEGEYYQMFELQASWYR
ncbi:ATP-binding cassette domain-containing protein [Paenibacillus albus]|nr:ATP-binding cassette domain-containing protein [Paenibacillus albus]